ncbi:hypothetical protein LWI29_026943 [Acer saccharum]|uniref:TF-B3 domain-containing protein n=1 Tax=Acer saccharum TaxID=4024 RepID=A0AA39VRZ7_ACESA|nr:hypothetical protein LWI29_026943 [Acer saccharum]
MAIFTRTLTRVDIERRLTIPRYCVGAFPAVQESQAVELKVNDEMGNVWTFRCSLQSAINPRLVFSSGWLHFASSFSYLPFSWLGPLHFSSTFGSRPVRRGGPAKNNLSSGELDWGSDPTRFGCCWPLGGERRGDEPFEHRDSHAGPDFIGIGSEARSLRWGSKHVLSDSL